MKNVIITLASTAALVMSTGLILRAGMADQVSRQETADHLVDQAIRALQDQAKADQTEDRAALAFQKAVYAACNTPASRHVLVLLNKHQRACWTATRTGNWAAAHKADLASQEAFRLDHNTPESKAQDRAQANLQRLSTLATAAGDAAGRATRDAKEAIYMAQ